MLPSPSQRATAGAIAVLLALACALGAAYLPPPAPWLLWLALPLLGYARIQRDAEHAQRWQGAEGWRRGLLALALPLAGGLGCDLLLGPLLQALRTPDRLYPLLGFSALIVGLVVAQWRSWPWFGLLFLSRLPASSPEHGIWQRLRERGQDLNSAPEAFFTDGLPVSCAGLAVLVAPLLLPWWPAAWPRVALALLLLALLVAAVELILRRTGHARRRPPPSSELPSFLLDGTLRAVEDPTDPDPAPPAIEPPSGPDADLLLAARRGDAAAVKLALSRGASADAQPPAEAADQRSALIAAATAADLGGLRALIGAGAQVNRVCAGLTALLAATRDSYAGRIDAVMTLLSNGADVNLADDGGNTPLHLAALTRDADVAQSLLDAGARLDAINREEMTPLGLACEAANWVVVEFLVKHGARSDVDGATPALLFAAAVDGDDPRGVKLLLKAKAKVNARGPQGRSALMVAALADNAEIADALLAAGAEVEARDDAGHSALLEAARAGANRVLQRLVFHKPDALATDQRGRGALHLAAQSGNAGVETLNLLLALGCPADACDQSGARAVDLAAAAGRWPLVRALDPEYPVPSSHVADENEPPAPAAERIEPDLPGRLLVRAAMQGRFPLYQELLQIPGISASELAEALRVASAHQDRRYVEAVLDQGFDAFARDGSGLSVWERLCAERPAPLHVLECLLEGAERNVNALASLLPGLCQLEFEAARGDQFDALRERALSLADPKACDAQGKPPLLLAVPHLPLSWIERLLGVGADANAQDPDGRSALSALAWSRRDDAREIAPLLIRAGADPAQKARDGTTAAGIARLTGQVELAALLDWPAGAHPGHVLDGRAVAAAGKRGDLATLDRLLSLGLDVDGVDEQGATALLHAVGTGQLELCKALHERGADLNRVSARGIAPLAAAILAGRSNIVDWLLARGVDIESVLLGRMTALALAAACLRLPLVESLLQRADPEGRAAADSPLQATLALVDDPARPVGAIQAVLSRLLEARANPDRPDADGRTPLHRLLGSGRIEPSMRDEARLQPILLTLLQGGANPNAPDRSGRTPLHWACRHGLVQCGGSLLELGADPRVTDDARQLPIDMLSPRYRIHLGPALRQAAEAWNRQRG
ncbi:MAG TPA: ankyrin repeat domain-containing protein [Xanthomonadales bacterium]|nr:ankyrin repeat domain-containing protein [Xanthomonadales bacterium]